MTPLFGKLLLFLKEVQLETKKVNWPKRQDTIKHTIVVILFSVAVATILSLFDLVFTSLMKRFIL
ncbi:MAG: preprotein translocase subunit SecE [Candidatus Wildermuthbacteria bacterium]|nr:preprotein translocase subunit SecE [Candidatus Wildermuthbacteria bacterium]